MFKNGMLGDIARMMPKFANISEEEIDLSPDGYMTDDESQKIDNVVISRIPSLNDPFTHIEDDCDDQCSANVPIGSAGNPISGKQPEAQLGAVEEIEVDPQFEMGMGKFAMEGEEGGAVIDDSAMKRMQKGVADNAMETTKDFFDQFAFKPQSHPKFDIDGYAPNNSTSATPIKKMPRTPISKLPKW